MVLLFFYNASIIDRDSFNAFMPIVFEILANFCGRCMHHAELTDCTAACDFDIPESALIDAITTHFITYITDGSQPFDLKLFRRILLILYIADLVPANSINNAVRLNRILRAPFHFSRRQFQEYQVLLQSRRREFLLKDHIQTHPRRFMTCVQRALYFLHAQNGNNAAEDVVDDRDFDHFQAFYGLKSTTDAGYTAID